MEPDEIRAEIERRKQKAKDLKLREAVWSLYSSQFKYIDDTLQKDPEVILPEVRESLKRENNFNTFHFREAEYCLVYNEDGKETDRWSGDVTDTTRYTLTLKVMGEVVFEFKAKKSVTYGKFEPSFDESMGRITAFIDGAWVAEVPELVQRMNAHRNEVWKARNAPKEAERLKQEMKKFGL